MKKTTTFIIGVTLLMSLFSFFTEAQAQNIGSLQSIVTPGFSFKKDLRLGDTDPDVRELQRVLNASIDTTVAIDGDGSRGHETTYFGNATKAAVIKFQTKYKFEILTTIGLTEGNGLVGQSTRKKLNLFLGVMETFPSAGLPQSRGTSASVTTTSTTYVAPTVITTNTQSSMSVCSFIELLINIGAIMPDKVNAARSVYAGMSCNTTNILAVNTNYPPSVVLKVNNQRGTVDVTPNTYVTISWISTNVTSCTSAGGSKPISGSQSLPITTSGTVAITCSGPGGTVTDSVAIRVSTVGTTNTTNISSSIINNSMTTTATTTATTTKSLNIYVNNKKSYSTTTDSMEPVYIFPAISWASSGFSACRITSSPKVSNLYETPVALNGTLFSSLLPSAHQGTTTFSLACATGTAVTILNQTMVSVLSSSTNLWIATSTLSIISTSTNPIIGAAGATSDPVEIPGSCDYTGTLAVPMYLPISFNNNEPILIGVKVNYFPECTGGARPRIFFANNQKDYTFEMFATDGNSPFNFRLANKKIFFTNARVGSIRNPGSDTDHYAIGTVGVGVGVEHNWLIERQGNQLKISRDNVLVGDWDFEVRETPSDIYTLNFPTWVSGLGGVTSGSCSAGYHMVNGPGAIPDICVEEEGGNSWWVNTRDSVTGAVETIGDIAGSIIGF